jgi:hypothetical protein
MRFSLIFIFALISVVLLSSESEAREGLEETFTVSVNPSWKYWEKTDCRMATDENGTYEECDSYLESETNLTNDWIISAPLDSEFTFTLNGTNFSSVATYNFSYKILTAGGYSGERHDIDGPDYVEEDIEITSSSLIFNGNNSVIFSYNLAGNLSSNLLINETRGQYLGDCVRLYAIVTLERSNNSIVEWTKLYTSASFLPGQSFAEYSDIYCHPYTPGAWQTPSLHFVAALTIISFVCVRKTRSA